MPAAASPCILTPSQIASFNQDGYLVVQGVFSSGEMVGLANEAERLLGLTDLKDSDNIRCRWQNHATTGECRFDCFDPVIDLSPVCEQLSRDPRLLEVISQVYGEPAHLFKDKLIYKPPGALGYNLHQDFISWPDFPTSFVTAIVAIDPADADSGATEVFPGYHQMGCLSPMDGMYHELTTEVVDLSKGVILNLQPGDVALFSGFTPHRSSANHSEHWRLLLYLSYTALRNVLGFSR